MKTKLARGDADLAEIVPLLPTRPSQHPKTNIALKQVQVLNKGLWLECRPVTKQLSSMSPLHADWGGSIQLKIVVF